MSNKSFVAFIGFVFALGFGAGFWASRLPRLETSKILGVIGLWYEFLGVAVLSEVATSRPHWKELSINLLAPAVLWTHTVAPLGSAFAGLILVFVHSFPSAPAVWKFAVGFWSYSLIPLGVLNETVVFSQFRVLKGVESRWRCFGLFLLANGVLLQLIAAIMSLNRSYGA